MSKPGKIALIGSGELTPSMVEVHKYLLRGARNGEAFFLDTPAGFQPNVEDIGRKAVEYFNQSVQQKIAHLSFREAAGVSTYDLGCIAMQLESAAYVLIGPGSPTYMLRQLSGSVLVDKLSSSVKSGGVLAIASAAALTAGEKTLPVYEIYKAGEELHWCEGLNLLGQFGLNISVVPHWNNAEGGTHDTRYCYMGEDRFHRLTCLLSRDSIFLGVDEHTACILDLHSDEAEVKGQGGVTLIQGGRQLRFSKNEKFSIDLLRQGVQVEIEETAKVSLSVHEVREKKAGTQADQYWQTVRALEERFRKGLHGGDYKESSTALLDFDTHLSKAASLFESDENLFQAREIYRELIVELSIELQHMADRYHGSFPPLVNKLLGLRDRYKKEKMWPEADEIRDVLNQFGVIIEDAKEGSSWYQKDDDTI